MRVAGICITGSVVRSRVVVSSSESCRTSQASLEFNMIHHLARAFAIRQQSGVIAAQAEPAHPAKPSTPTPVRPRPITPWGSPAKPGVAGLAPRAHAHTPAQGVSRVRISADPHDARRTVIAGRFAEVCAALDRMVMEQEAIA